jgi:hypothetical protein
MRLTATLAFCATPVALALCALSAPNPRHVTLETVSAALRQADKAHPTLFADAAAFQTLRERTCATDLGKLALARLRFEADQIVPFRTCVRELEGRRLLGVSRTVLHRVSVLAMTYRLTGERAYLDRCAAELRAAAGFTDWNPSHFLDVAEMTLALAVGYDWLYADLDDATRETVSAALLEKGLKASLKHTGWVKASNNWGQVCHAGMLAGALALMDRHADLASEIAHRAITHLPLSMRAFAPNGCYPEGPGYWSYGTDFNVLALAMLQHTFKSDFGLASLPGFRETADYLDLVTGPSGLPFNYADCGRGRGTDCASWWLAHHFDRPDTLAYFEKRALTDYCANRTPLTPNHAGNRLFAFTLFWLQPVPVDLAPKSPLNWSSENEVPITIHRSTWDNAKALFVGFKAGSPSGPHGHMDAGSFVLDADGVRWAYDLGMESYHRIESRKMNLWSPAQNSDRWRVFRLSSLSHNTLVIDGQLQLARGKSTVLAFRDGPEPSTTLDLSPVYTNASQVVRTGTLLPTGEFRLDDTLKGLRPGAAVRWGMVTKAAPDASRTGPLVLREAGKQLRLTPLHDPATAWKTYETAKTPNEWDSPNPGTVMVGFEAVAPASGDLALSLLFTPGSAQR